MQNASDFNINLTPIPQIEPKVSERGAKEQGSRSKSVPFFSLELQSPKKAMKQRELIKFVYQGASCQRATGETK